MKVYVVCKAVEEHSFCSSDYYLQAVDSVWSSKKEAQKYCDQKNRRVRLYHYMIWKSCNIKDLSQKDKEEFNGFL